MPEKCRKSEKQNGRVMGGGVSSTAESSNLPLIKLEYLAQLKKPIDGSDCNDDLILAKNEISKLRNLCHSIDPKLVEEFLNQQQEQQEKKKEEEEVMRMNKKNQGEKEMGVDSPIVNLLKDKLENRLVSLKEAFRKIDTTNTGFITKEEFIQVNPLTLLSSPTFSPLSYSCSHAGIGEFNLKKMTSHISQRSSAHLTNASNTRNS
jgi:hypothetical protein